jgi:hypothetical protein
MPVSANCSASECYGKYRNSEFVQLLPASFPAVETSATALKRIASRSKLRRIGRHALLPQQGSVRHGFLQALASQFCCSSGKPAGR